MADPQVSNLNFRLLALFTTWVFILYTDAHQMRTKRAKKTKFNRLEWAIIIVSIIQHILRCFVYIIYQPCSSVIKLRLQIVADSLYLCSIHIAVKISVDCEYSVWVSTARPHIDGNCPSHIEFKNLCVVCVCACAGMLCPNLGQNGAYLRFWGMWWNRNTFDRLVMCYDRDQCKFDSVTSYKHRQIILS